MTQRKHAIAETLIGQAYEAMDASTKRVAQRLTERRHVSQPQPLSVAGEMTLAQRAADAVARFGGSWTFIGLFALVLVAWVVLNSWILWRMQATFDPYPYILLNLFLSMLASVQAPIILMSQNRQADIDRQQATHDYEVNLKAELEILLLHDKIDALREQQWQQLIDMQQQQIALLEKLVNTHKP